MMMQMFFICADMVAISSMYLLSTGNVTSMAKELSILLYLMSLTLKLYLTSYMLLVATILDSSGQSLSSSQEPLVRGLRNQA